MKKRELEARLSKVNAILDEALTLLPTDPHWSPSYMMWFRDRSTVDKASDLRDKIRYQQHELDRLRREHRIALAALMDEKKRKL